jgi:hypothetical protein
MMGDRLFTITCSGQVLFRWLAVYFPAFIMGHGLTAAAHYRGL